MKRCEAKTSRMEVIYKDVNADRMQTDRTIEKAKT